MTPNGEQRYGRPSGRLYFMRKGDFDGYHHVADHHFAHIDFVWWWLLRARSLVVAESIAPNSQAHRGLKEARLAGQPSPGFRVFGGR